MCPPLFLVTFGCPLSWKKTALLQAKTSTVLLVDCSGQQTAALSQNHSFKPSGNGNPQSSHQDDQTNFSEGLFTIASSRKTTITLPHMLHRAHGGVLAMQVLQILGKLRKKAGLVIYPSLRRTRSGSSITRWLRMFTLKRSRTMDSTTSRCSSRSSSDGDSRACRSCSCSEEAEEELVPDLVEP